MIVIYNCHQNIDSAKCQADSGLACINWEGEKIYKLLQIFNRLLNTIERSFQ